MSHYTFADVLRYDELPRNRLKRWVQAGIIVPEGAGSPEGWRRFSFRNLIEAKVCDELRGLGVGEPGLHKIITALNAYLDVPDEPINSRDPDSPKIRDAAILWVAFQRLSDPPIETVAVYPVTTENLVSRLTDGLADGSGVAETGIAIPLARIIADLERATGDVFDLTAYVRRKLTEALGPKDRRDE